MTATGAPSLTPSDSATADLEAAIQSGLEWHAGMGTGPCRSCLDNLTLLEMLTAEVDQLAMEHLTTCACLATAHPCDEYRRIVGMKP